MPSLAVLALVAALTLQSPPTSLPDAPGSGLGLEPGPAPVVSVHPAAGSGTFPARREPLVPAAVASLAAGMAALAARTRRIREAEAVIRESLQDNLLSDVGHDDLTTIERRIAELPVHEATAVVARLSDEELRVWMRELDGWRGGLSSEEEAGLFALLAERVRPAQLSRVAAAGKLPELVAAASAGAPEPWRPEFARRLWAQHSAADEGWHSIGDLVESVSAPVLATSLEHSDLRALSEDLFDPYRRHANGTAVLELGAPTRFLRTAARVDDSRLKATIFLTFNRRMLESMDLKVSGPTKRSELLGSLAAVLLSDPEGTVTELNHRLDPHANITAAWLVEMIHHDRLDELDVLLAGLSGAPDRLGHFTDPGSSPAAPYPNAANLGYYVGAYSRAIELISDHAADQAELVSRLFTLFTGVVTLPGGGRVGLPLSPLVDAHAAGVAGRLRDGAANLKQTLWGLAKPRAQDGRLWNGVGTSQFQDAWQEVVDVR